MRSTYLPWFAEPDSKDLVVWCGVLWYGKVKRGEAQVMYNTPPVSSSFYTKYCKVESLSAPRTPRLERLSQTHDDSMIY